MGCDAAARFLWRDEYRLYDFGRGHPLNPIRLAATRDLVAALGWLGPAQEVSPPPATEAELELAHTRAYIEAVTAAGEFGLPTAELAAWGLGTDDNPVFRGMHEAGLYYVGGTLAGARFVAEAPDRHAFNVAGGLHHAQAGRASGFCVYNDLAVAIRWLRRERGFRVAYVDTDAHHGDGVEAAFYDDPGVLTISLHESGRYLFPGTGAVEDRGQGAAFGTAVNVPLEPATDDVSWLEAFDRVVPAALDAFAPDVLVSQHGCDSHAWDPLADLSLTTWAYREAARRLHEYAHRWCGGRWVAVGGGGYEALRVVPRAWALVWGEMTGQETAVAVPEVWLKRWQGLSAEPLPAAMVDPPETAGPETDRTLLARALNRRTVNRLLAGVPWGPTVGLS